MKQSTPQASPAIFGTFPLLESNQQKSAHATTGADNRKPISMGPRPQGKKALGPLANIAVRAGPARQGINPPEGNLRVFIESVR